LILLVNMGTNTVRARVAFSFKGETYELDSVIDLGRCLGEPGADSGFLPAAGAGGRDRALLISGTKGGRLE
jgi:hypothetical protein